MGPGTKAVAPHTTSDGQGLGTPGTWHGAWSEHGPPCRICAVSTAETSTEPWAVAGSACSRAACPPLMSMAKPFPATVRWRKNTLAISRAERWRRAISGCD